MTKKARTTTKAAGKPTRPRKGPQSRTRAPKTEQAPDTAAAAPDATSARPTRAGSKQAKLIEMLRQPNGASIDEIVAALGWQKHTVRGAFSGALKKKLGLKVDSDKVEGRGRVYRISD